MNAHRCFSNRQPAIVLCRGDERAPVSLMQGKEAREEFRLFGPAFDCEEIYDLYEQARVPCACAPDGLDQFAETRQETIMPDAQEPPRWNVAHARRFDDNRARS